MARPRPKRSPSAWRPSSTRAEMTTMGKDVVSGTAGTDRIDGLAGDDVISGLDGNDILWGGAGRDTVKKGLRANA